MEDLDALVLHDLDPDAQDLLRKIQVGQRLDTYDVEYLIVMLCRVRPFSVRELAKLLNRNPRYVRRSYLTPLVEDGVLLRTRLPNDPNVKYETIDY